MSQAYIGYHLQNAIENQLHAHGIDVEKSVVTVITRRSSTPTTRGSPDPPSRSAPSSPKSRPTSQRPRQDDDRGLRAWLPRGRCLAAADRHPRERTRSSTWSPAAISSSPAAGRHTHRLPRQLVPRHRRRHRQGLGLGPARWLRRVRHPRRPHRRREGRRRLQPRSSATSTSSPLAQAQEYVDQGQFPEGSMPPKIEAAMRFTGSARAGAPWSPRLTSSSRGCAARRAPGSWPDRDPGTERAPTPTGPTVSTYDNVIPTTRRTMSTVSTSTDTLHSALEDQFGLADRVVDEGGLGRQRRAVPRARDRHADLRPARRPLDLRRRPRRRRRPAGPDARNLWRVTWFNDKGRQPGRGARARRPAVPLTGIASPVVVVFGNRFPMITAHKVLAAYACLARAW